MSATPGGSSTGPDAPRPIAAGWLELREPADREARDRAAEVLSDLPEALRRPGLRVVDLGSGTGSNQRWLAPHLPEPATQQWVLVDHDPGLLARGPARARSVRADVTDLAQVLADVGGADLVTAAALLDLLDRPQLTAVVEAVVEARVPALFSLSVTGAVELDPPHRTTAGWPPRSTPTSSGPGASGRRRAR